jgi:hypothetical protein
VAPRGTESLKESELLYLARMMDVQTTSSCAHCGKSWTGWLATVQEAYKAHRLEKHPEIQPRARRPRTRAHTLVRSSTQSSLEDNIANARANGGASWAGPE